LCEKIEDDSPSAVFFFFFMTMILTRSDGFLRGNDEMEAEVDIGREAIDAFSQTQ
jgi:hypothetical protein